MVNRASVSHKVKTGMLPLDLEKRCSLETRGISVSGLGRRQNIVGAGWDAVAGLQPADSFEKFCCKKRGNEVVAGRVRKVLGDTEHGCMMIGNCPSKEAINDVREAGGDLKCHGLQKAGGDEMLSNSRRVGLEELERLSSLKQWEG